MGLSTGDGDPGGAYGDLLNYADIAGQTGVAVDTVKRYVLVLEKT